MKKAELAWLERRNDAFAVRVMARAEGYAMVRRHGCMPFIVPEKELTTIPDQPGKPSDYPTT